MADLKDLRTKAWDHFLKLGLPEKSAEPFRYFPLREFYNEPLACHLGKLEASLPILSLADAMRTYGSFLTSRLTKWLKEETDPFAAMNLALHQSSAFFYIQPKSEQPIQIRIDGGVSRVHLFVGAHAKAVCEVTGEVEKGFSHLFFDVALEEGAELCLVNRLTSKNWLFYSLRATLKKNSLLKSYALTKGVRQDYQVKLMQENAEAVLKGLWTLAGHEQNHTHILMEHEAPHCRSLQHFKGVNSDFSQSSFEGKILVRDIAQKTEAFQRNNNLILGQHAIAYSKPNLEIFADDVKASHGATVSQLEEGQLHYLKTRGIPQELAKEMLVESFAREILNEVPCAR